MSRRTILILATALCIGALGAPAHAQQQKLKVGLMLPFTGTFAALGTAIENGFKLYVQEQGGRLGGREIEYFRVDDESDPSKATDNIGRLINRDKVDVVVGTVHSGVVMAMAKVARDSNTLLIVPNAGANAITGRLCAEYLPIVVLKLAVSVCGRGCRRRTWPQDRCVDDLEVRGG